MNEPMPVKEQAIHLAVQQITAQIFADFHGIAPENIQEHVHYSLEYLAHLLRVSLHLPTLELEDRVVAEWPATWWQHIKARLGWKHRTCNVRLSQVLVVPEIPAPLRGFKSVRKIVYLNGVALTERAA